MPSLTLDDIKDNWTKAINNVVFADSLDVMKLIPDNAIPLVLCDPPYGINMGGNAQIMSLKSKPKWEGCKYKKKGWDEFIPSKEYFDEIKRISKNQIIFGGNYFTDYLEQKKGWIFWDKKMSHNKNFSHGELAWTSFDCVLRMFSWTATGYSSNKEHPTQKPLELMVWCLENYLLKNWKEDRKPIVFDGFAGSGTTGVACKKCGCDFILVEKEKDYVDICNKRLAQESLF